MKMKNMKIFVFCLILSVGVGVYSAKLPDYLKKCKKTDNAQCAMDNAIAAINVLSKDGESKFQLQNLKPVHVAKIDLQATPQLKVVLEDVDFHGIDTLQVKASSINENEIKLNVHVNHMELVGKYDINGKILILPIQGKGTCNITLVDFDLDYTAKLTTEERKGKKYLTVEQADNTKVKIENLKRVHWNFDNLFNGDPRLGPEMNRFLNENWVEVYEEVRAAIEQVADFSIFSYFINGYLHYLPIDELFES